jgi:hypothetical protein
LNQCGKRRQAEWLDLLLANIFLLLCFRDCGFVMADLREQRVCIKFCFRLGKTAAETHGMLKQAFGDNSLGQTQTYDWYKRFKNGRTSTDDDDRLGRPSTGTTPENVAKVRDLILQDRRLTIHDLCNTLGLSYGTIIVQNIGY